MRLNPLRCAPASAPRPVRSGLLALGLTSLAVLGTLSGCGGTVTAYKPFVATSMVVLGDEASALVTSNGQTRKFGINGLSADASKLDCQANPLWVQTVASSYQLSFDACPFTSTSGTATTALGKATMQAKAGQTTQGVIQELNTLRGNIRLNADGRSTELVSIMVGSNDVLAAYKNYNGSNVAALQASLKQSGSDLAQAINNFTNSGGRVLFAFPLDLGQSPYARAENKAPTVAASTATIDRVALLSSLVEAFRQGFVGNLILDGHTSAVVAPSIVAHANATTGTNSADAACQGSNAANPSQDNAAALACTSSTLVTGATSSSHTWATALQPSPLFQNTLAALAVQRVQGNPL